MPRAKYDFSLERVPKGYPAGSVYAPDVYGDGEEFRTCSIQGCPYKPAYELYHGRWLYDMETPAGLTDGWWTSAGATSVCYWPTPRSPTRAW